jgi:uncharacterized protein YdaT
MPWNKTQYPNSMKNLKVVVRNKAIEIANAMLEEKPRMNEGIIIATSINHAKDWATNKQEAVKGEAQISNDTVMKRPGKGETKTSYNPRKKVSEIKTTAK